MIRYLPFIALCIVMLGLASATVIEKFYGNEVSATYFYHSPWMIAMFVICSLTGLVTVMALRKTMTVATLSLHVSLALILAGAAVTFFWGKYGSIRMEIGNEKSEFNLSNGDTCQLPFSISLAGIGIEYFPGTHSPRDYYSIVKITGNGYSCSHRVSMNHPLDVQGYRFCQSALGEGCSTLVVNYDVWGVGITFVAYGLLFVSMIAALLERNGSFRRNLRRLTAVVALPVVGFSCTVDAAESRPIVLQRPLANTFGTLYILNNGRVQPIQTFARDFCVTVCGNEQYNGFTSEQVLTGWIFYYDSWKHEPMIKLKSRLAREAVGGKSRVSLAELYAGGRYCLEPVLDANPCDRSLVSDNNTVTLITSVCTGSALTTVPLSDDDGNLTWYSWTERLPPGTSGATSEEIHDILSGLFHDINHGYFRNANDLILRLRRVQESVAGDTLPSEFSVESERLYNRTFYPLLSAVLTLIAGIVLLIMYLYNIQHLNRLVIGVVMLLAVYVTYILALRWIIGHHAPFSTGYETMIILAWIAMVLSLCFGRKILVVRPLGMIVGGISLLVAMMGSRNPVIGPVIPVLTSRMLSLHVMLVMMSYALFGIITLSAIIGLIWQSKRERLSLVCKTFLVPALFLLGAGIFTGAIWANQSWGRYWGWDSKETWALVTFILYALPVHTDSLRYFKSEKTFLIYLPVAFVSVLMTYFGVNYLLPGLHSYGAG